MKKKSLKIFTVLYVIVLGYLLFIRGINYSESPFINVNLIPFETIKRYIYILQKGDVSNFLINVIGNIVVFIPFGLIFPYYFKKLDFLWKMIMIAIIFPVCIECLQYIFHVGIMDIDDVILNFVGIITGFLIFRGFSHEKS